jgi:cellulose synthase/poly-beta-1,6-N-acetylglucosamine synthase-like glycosyltransferase
MEIIVRLQRYILDKRHDGRIAFLPHPVAWTEVPETFASLRKQRGRWYRGLRESLRYHRAMLWKGKFGRIGWFALPAFWIFEYLGPLIEIAGYAFLALLLVLEGALNLELLSTQYLLVFLLVSLGYGVLVNVLAVLVGSWRFRYGLADRLQRRLLPFSRRREVMTLLLYAVLENFGYRQLTLYWRMRGLWDAWLGKTGWEKFSRVGFRPGQATAHG